MKIEELKKVRDILSNVLQCHKTEDFDEDDYDEALDTAITVIGDVIKQMERIQMGGHVSTNE